MTVISYSESSGLPDRTSVTRPAWRPSSPPSPTPRLSPARWKTPTTVRLVNDCDQLLRVERAPRSDLSDEASLASIEPAVPDPEAVACSLENPDHCEACE